ncbi:E3 ubiquitin-protein ligase CHFR [Rhizoctonia solani AG-1 IB]|uniref:E3 ubiquitin-protein ligase CHFR n=1 Tax=Thanatephorus cucumeris (strain AG1-IB / isolate 7/3/14) TaxID=1108050 RepID=A0A0B7FHV1_THACB|nr:E3 ubiquitin-protein ligase CHFR [Rhizoctonia solani AG-1 IB]
MSQPTNQQSEANAHGQDTESEGLFRPLVTCGICLQLYVDPVALLDCLHLACGSCAKEWLKSSDSCHQCRGPVRGARDSHHTLAVVEAYQLVAPNSSLCQERTPEIIASLRESYKPGQQLTIGEGNEDDSDGHSGSSEDEDEYNESYREGLDSGGLRLYDDSCPFCDPSNESNNGFVCPQPCIRSNDDTGMRTIPVGHTLCSQCYRFLPVRDELHNTRCAVCTRTTCSEFGKTCLSGSVEDRPELHLAVLSDVEFPSYFGFPLTHAFGDNEHERDIFSTWATGSGLDLQDLFREILAFRGPHVPKASWHGNANGAIGSPYVTVDDKVCVSCTLDLVESSLFEWWLSKRQSGTAELPEDVTTRDDCWYGIECRTARHNYRHARTYNHICRKIVADQQTESHNPSERGNRYMVESDDLHHTFPAFSPSDIIFRDKGKEPSFMCSSVRGTELLADTIPGKVTIWGPGYGVQAYYGEDGEEHSQDGQVQLLIDTRNMRWVRSSGRLVPEGCRPIIGGTRAQAGGILELYHCAVWWHGQRVPGYACKELEYAAITWGGQEWYFKDNYEILCWN